MPKMSIQSLKTWAEISRRSNHVSTKEEQGWRGGGRPGVSTGMQELKWIQPPLSFTCVSLTLMDWLTQKAGNNSVRVCGTETCKPHVKAWMKRKAEVNSNEEIYYFKGCSTANKHTFSTAVEGAFVASDIFIILKPFRHVLGWILRKICSVSKAICVSTIIISCSIILI